MRTTMKPQKSDLDVRETFVQGVSMADINKAHKERVTIRPTFQDFQRTVLVRNTDLDLETKRKKFNKKF